MLYPVKIGEQVVNAVAESLTIHTLCTKPCSSKRQKYA